MGYMLTTNLLGILITGPIAIVMCWGMARTLDKIAGRRFSDAYEKMLTDPDALARYHGQRFLGICILIGLVVLKSV